MDTVPLLTPSMETELLKEPWVFPQPKMNVTKEDEKAPSFTWEENFQDLSGWCMDTFQGQCDFHTGESPTFKLSGTKYEGNSVLSSEEGVLKDLMSVGDEEKWSLKMNTAETTKHSNNSCPSLQSTSNVTSKYERKDSPTESNTSNLWLKLSKGSTATVNTSSWNKQSITDVSTPFQSRYQIEDIDLKDACPTSFDSTENQREAWDVLRTVETTGSDTFDLLSYVCDDEMHSPDGSVSTDSSIASKPWSSSKLSATIPQTSVKVKTEKNETVTPECRKSRTAASTVTSSSTEVPVVSTRRTERTRISVNNKIEKPYNRVRRERSTRKRYVESDSEDQPFVSHYRESREKNNEASRKSRMNKKAKETEMAKKALELERDNRILKMKVEELEKLVTSMRSALLKSALKKE
ncbi:hypothetical protein WN48_02238, partial [Eufriesea mexicana]